MSSNLEQRVVVIGGASGIGEAASRKFHSEGHPVFIGDRDTENGRRVQQDLDSEFGFVDVMDDVSMKEFARKIMELGGVTHMVYTPGGPVGEEMVPENSDYNPVTDMSHEASERSVAFNYLAYRRALRIFCPLLENNPPLESSFGAVTSINMLGKYGLIDYSASKAAIEAAAIVAANQFGPQIRFYTVAPGSTETPATAKENMNFEAVAQSTGLQRVTQPEDVALMMYSLAKNIGISGQRSSIVDSLQFLAADNSRYEE